MRTLRSLTLLHNYHSSHSCNQLMLTITQGITLGNDTKLILTQQLICAIFHLPKRNIYTDTYPENAFTEIFESEQ